jgi:hypothetical protein
MDKEKKNRSGSVSNRSGKNEGGGSRKRDHLPGAPSKSNRQTKGHDENAPEVKTGTKKGPNSI